MIVRAFALEFFEMRMNFFSLKKKKKKITYVNGPIIIILDRRSSVWV